MLEYGKEEYCDSESGFIRANEVLLDKAAEVNRSKLNGYPSVFLICTF